jgi:hypothetical protein
VPAAAPILCALLAAFQVTSGTVGERLGAETRVRGIDLAVEGASGLEDEASAGTHRGIIRLWRAADRYNFALTYLARIILAAVWYPTPSC